MVLSAMWPTSLASMVKFWSVYRKVFTIRQ